MSGPEVEILMGVCDGSEHLPAQLESLAAQTHTKWRLTVSDDSSGPRSAGLIADFGMQISQPVEFLAGPQQGFAANYMHLIRRLRPGYVALADQDDVWLPHKISRALSMLPKDKPALYCARSFYWRGGQRRQISPLYPRPAEFRNALIENVAQGNTIVLNPAAAALAKAAATEVDAVFAQDWWLYLLISGAGGRVVVDNGPPVLLYRQHAGNLIGAGQRIGTQIRRKRAVMAGAFGVRLTLNVRALQECRMFLTDHNRSILDAFAAAREQALPKRLVQLGQLGLYRQRRIGSLGFWGAAFLGWV